MALVPGLVSVVFGPLNPHCFSNSCGRYPLLLFGVLRKTIAEKPSISCAPAQHHLTLLLFQQTGLVVQPRVPSLFRCLNEAEVCGQGC